MSDFRSTDPKQLDTAYSLAQFLNVSVACIRKYTRLTNIPVVRIGHAVRYDRTAVLAWLRDRQQQHPEEK